MKPLNELDAVALTCDLPGCGLVRGDVGTVVLVHRNGEACEVEFVGYDGHTVALVTLEAHQVRPLDSHDIPHARELKACEPEPSAALLGALGALGLLRRRRA